MMEKSSLRKEMKALRTSLSPAQKEEIERKIAQSILQSAYYRDADSLLCYAAYGSEISVDRIAKAAWEDGKRVCFPRCEDDRGVMRFYAVEDPSMLVAGMYGILEPDEGCVPMEAFSSTALCLVPGLAFDARGYRIGYGKGYYDRFLPRFDGIAMGVCPACMLFLTPQWEYDRYDIALPCIVTEHGVRQTEQEE